MRRFVPILFVVVASCRVEHAASGRPPGEATAVVDSLAQVEADSALTAGVQAALRLHYQRYAARDWRAFRRTFWPGATIGQRGTPPGERGERAWIQTVDDFARRQAEAQARPSVLGERVLHMHVTGYGDVADAWVIAERRVSVRRDSVRILRGVDAFHLIRDGTEWRIAGLTASPEDPGHRLVTPARRAVRGGASTEKRSTAPRSAP